MSKYYQLWLQLTRRDIAARHKGSYLGVVWLLLTPLLEFAVYATVFGVIFGGHYRQSPPEPKQVYALGVFLCLTLYRFMAEAISVSPGLVVSQPNFVKKVVFPLQLLPLSAIGSITYRTGLSCLLFLVGFVLFGPGFSIHFLWVPVVLLPLVILAIGVAWLFSALGVFLRDISQIVGVGTLIMLYSSGVFYSTDMMKAKSQLAWVILRFNPLLHIMENVRRVTLWKEPPVFSGLIYTWITALITLYLGHIIFKKLRPTFADVI
ncbi:MAG: ABC transporter permease [Verrucomicrobiota bacterium]